MQYDPALAGTAACQGFQRSIRPRRCRCDCVARRGLSFGRSYPGFHKLVREYAKRRKDPDASEPPVRGRELADDDRPEGGASPGLRASEIPAFAAALAQAVGVAGVNAPPYAWTDEQQKFLAALAKDLKAKRGKSAVLPGLYQDDRWRSSRWLSTALGNVGKTVTVAPEPVIRCRATSLRDFKTLVADLNAGKVDWLVILNANPIYTAPADLELCRCL